MRKSIQLTYLFQAMAVGLMLTTCWFAWENMAAGHWFSVLMNAASFLVSVWLYFVLASTRKKLKSVKGWEQ